MPMSQTEERIKARGNFEMRGGHQRKVEQRREEGHGVAKFVETKDSEGALMAASFWLSKSNK